MARQHEVVPFGATPMSDARLALRCREEQLIPRANVGDVEARRELAKVQAELRRQTAAFNREAAERRVREKRVRS